MLSVFISFRMALISVVVLMTFFASSIFHLADRNCRSLQKVGVLIYLMRYEYFYPTARERFKNAWRKIEILFSFALLAVVGIRPRFLSNYLEFFNSLVGLLGSSTSHGQEYGKIWIFPRSAVVNRTYGRRPSFVPKRWFWPGCFELDRSLSIIQKRRNGKGAM